MYLLIPTSSNKTNNNGTTNVKNKVLARRKIIQLQNNKHK